MQSNRPTLSSTADGGELVTIPINEPGGRHGELKKLYKKRADQWLLLTEDEQTEEKLGAVTLKSTVHRDHKKYVFWVNTEKEKERAEWRKNHPAGTPTRVASVPSLVAAVGPAPSLRSPAPDLRTTVPQPHADRFIDNGPGQGLALVHGVKSDENTWFPRMEPWLVGDPSPYAFSRILVPSLQWRQNIEQQSADLQGRATVLGANALFIGHSMGGLLSRRVGQRNTSYPGGLVKGVVTIDTPHQGAIIAKVLGWPDFQRLINNLRTISLIKICYGLNYYIRTSSVACILDAAAAKSVIDLAEAYGPGNASSDLQPNSYGILALNAANEPFIRGGVQNRIEGRFKWARLYGDSDHNPEEPFGGRWAQRVTSEFFLFLRHCHNAWWLGASSECGVLYSTILHLDESFERHIDPGHYGSDGIVTMPSQVYPNTPSTVGPPRNWTITNGDSHVGALKTTFVRDAILVRILPFYGLPRK